MGSSDFYPEEGPAHEVLVAEFELDPHPVTNAQFAAFVEATGYVTVAERPIDPADYPGIDVSATRRAAWSSRVLADRLTSPTGAPGGRGGGSILAASFRLRHDDRRQGAASGRAGEFRGRRRLCGVGGKTGYPPKPSGSMPRAAAIRRNGPSPGEPSPASTAVSWRTTGRAGARSSRPVRTDGWARRRSAPSPGTAYGLVDMIGNVWEWTSTFYSERHKVEGGEHAGHEHAGHVACGPEDSRRRGMEPGSIIPRRALKGGSHLCAPEHTACATDPPARSPQAEDTATTHIGFRTAR